MVQRAITACTIACAVAVTLVASVGAGAVEYFASNRHGIPLTPLTSEQRDEPEWLLVVDSAAEAAEAGLLARRRLSGPDGAEREWRTSMAGGLTQEEELGDGLLLGRLLFTATGQLEREERYADGALTEIDHWVYQQRRPVRMTTVDAAGTVLAVREYQLSAVGRLRRVTFAAGGAPAADSGSGELALMFRDGRLVQERATESGRHMVSRFLANGQRQSLEQWREGLPLSTSRWTYGEDGVVVDEVVVDHEAGTSVRVDHDAAGRALVKRTWSAGPEAAGTDGDGVTAGAGATLLEERWFTWGVEGDLVRERAVSDRGVEVWEYRYDTEGTRVGEQYLLRGALVRSTEYHPDDARTDTLYRNGRPALRVFWQGDERVGEELIADDG